MNNTLLSLQDFAGNPIRVYGSPDAPLFVAADVCRVLEIVDVTSALRSLDEDEKGPLIVRTLGGNQTMNGITESGLYALIFKSRKPEAKTFRKWVTAEVLPAIRQTGRYEAPQRITKSEPVNELFLLMKELRKKHVSHDVAAQVASEMVRSMAHRRQRQQGTPRLPRPKRDHSSPMLEIASKAGKIASLDLLNRWCQQTGCARSMGYRTIKELLSAGKLIVAGETHRTRIITLA
ncbi:MAG TPA: Bro-N domain-containing protein [Chthoniobacteraceae bacterium]|nr:Bro-N domain-containing protein [Chthoniobacteraceae bacterium]